MKMKFREVLACMTLTGLASGLATGQYREQIGNHLRNLGMVDESGRVNIEETCVNIRHEVASCFVGGGSEVEQIGMKCKTGEAALLGKNGYKVADLDVDSCRVTDGRWPVFMGHKIPEEICEKLKEACR